MSRHMQRVSLCKFFAENGLFNDYNLCKLDAYYHIFINISNKISEGQFLAESFLEAL